MKKQSEDRFVILSTMSRLEATKILNARDKQGWKLRGFAVRDQDFEMVFEKEEEEGVGWTARDVLREVDKRHKAARKRGREERRRRWREKRKALKDTIKQHLTLRA